jgi:hypothetical protein
MASHGHGHHTPLDASKGYEQSDLAIGGIVKGVGCYFVFTAAVGAVVFIAFLVFHQTKLTSADIGPQIKPPQPYPLLQNDITAHTDIWNLRKHEDYLLSNTTWVDKNKGILRIPIDDAIEKESQLGPKGADSGATAETAPVPSGTTPPPSVPPTGSTPAPESAGGTGNNSVQVKPSTVQPPFHSAPPATTIPSKPIPTTSPSGHAMPIKGGRS